jgi:DNA-binding NarL/FixJ family response regulator
MVRTTPKASEEGHSAVAKVLIVDDHPSVREGLASRISRQADLVVCGEVADIAEALRFLENTRPDIVVVDISLKSGNGIDLIKRIKARDSSIRMLAFSMYPDSLYAERALRAGALGYINKENTTGRILDAIRTVRDGEIYLSEETTKHLLNRTIGRPQTSRISLVESLSNRELETFELLGEGLTTNQIAARLHLSIYTVDTYRRRIKQKLSLQNAAELINAAAQWVLVEQQNERMSRSGS